MSTPAQPTQFPHHIKISLEIDIIVDNQEEQNYFIDTNAHTTIDYIADIFDGIREISKTPYSINNLTQEDIRREMNKKAGIVP